MLTTSVAAGAAMLSLLVNGVPLQATYLQGDRDGCDVVRETARQWQKHHGVQAAQVKLEGWCTVGAVISGQWVSEQWRTQRVLGKVTGWRVVIPLAQRQAGVSTGAGVHISDAHSWHLDVFDREIATRIRYRQSLQSLDHHHQQSHRALGKASVLPVSSPSANHPLRLSRHRNGEVLVSGRHPDGGSYSVLIERGIEK